MGITYSKELSVYAEADIVVIGGGPAGIAAAVTAARLGRRVLLLEESGSLGGASVLAMVPELMNFDDGEHFVSGGIGKEIFESLGYTCSYERKWYNVRCEELKRIYDRMVTESGAELLLYTRVVDAVCEENRVTHAIISSPEGVFAVKGAFFIDCTGSGSFSVLAGADCEYGNESGKTMSATLCSLWGGVDFSRKERDANNYERAYRDGVFSRYDSVLPGIKANYPELGVGGGNVGHCFEVDDRDARSLTQAMLEGRAILWEYERYYRGYVPGCENATLLRSADRIGIRESRRIVCEYMLTEDAFFQKDAFYDEIGRYSYPIDIHPMTPDKAGMQDFSKSVSIRHGRGETYSIPYRALVPKHTRNLLVAGRCIGADRSMQASVRVIPCCYITGQAAGVGASVSLACSSDAAKASTSEIRRILRERGAYLCKSHP